MAYQEFGVDRVRQQQELHAVGWALLCRSLPYEPASWDDVTRHEAAAALARAARFIAMIDAQPPAGGGEDGRRGGSATKAPRPAAVSGAGATASCRFELSRPTGAQRRTAC